MKNNSEQIMQLWLRRLTRGRDSSMPGHIMLGDEDLLDKDRLEQQSSRRPDVTLTKTTGSASGATTPTMSTNIHQQQQRNYRQSRSRPSAAAAFLSDDSAGECRIGHTVLSSYCCVVLLIFSFLFILIGSMLTHMYYFAKQRDDNVQVSQFLHKHSYLKEVSPFVICLGVVMLVSGVSFLIIRRCRRPSPGRYVESLHNDAYFPPDDDDRLAHSRRGSSHLIGSIGGGAGGLAGAGMIGRNSITSPVSSHAVSPLLAPTSSCAFASSAEWKWPTNAMTTTTTLGGENISSLSSSPLPPSSSNRRPSANGSPTPLDPLEISDVNGKQSSPTLTVPVFDATVPSVLTIPVTSNPTLSSQIVEVDA